jgi:hypothetical protein
MTLAQDTTQPAKLPAQVLQGEREASTKSAPWLPMVHSTPSSQPMLISFRTQNLQSRSKPPNAPKRQSTANQQIRPIHHRQNTSLLPNDLLLNLLAPSP